MPKSLNSFSVSLLGRDSLAGIERVDRRAIGFADHVALDL
jgi:hypothetical protein